MPPMVLYRILGVTDIMRGSVISGIVAVVSDSRTRKHSLEYGVEAGRELAVNE